MLQRWINKQPGCNNLENSPYEPKLSLEFIIRLMFHDSSHFRPLTNISERKLSIDHAGLDIDIS